MLKSCIYKTALQKILLYLEFSKKSFQQSLQYRIANLSGFAVNTFFFIVRAFVFIALYENFDVVANFNVTEVVTFAGITQALIMIIGLFSTLEIANLVRSGEVAVDLMKPIDYQLTMLFRQFGRSLYYLIFRGTPIFLVMVIFFDWTHPISLSAIIAFGFSVILAIIITFSFNYIIGISAFWLLDARGISNLLLGSGILLSGFVVPISFFPTKLAEICEWLPFIGQSYTPVAVYLGKYAGQTMINMIMRQLMWAFILMIIGKIYTYLAMRKLVIQGG